tara:strand:- start:33 stop:779 length:747 start_codon:yes stop_codon:yes gene_type:complete
MVIKNSGNVGIGTASPAEKLHVFGGAAAIEIDSTTNEAALKYDNSTTTATIKLANNDLKTELGGSEVMRILANGNVGIGTTNPGEKLEVVGKILIKGNASFSYGSEIYATNMEASFSNQVQSQSSAILSTVSDGTFKLRSVYAGANIGSFGGSQNVTIGAFSYGNVHYMTGHPTKNHVFKGAYSNDLMTILGTGNVGIGTTNPGSKLGIAGGDVEVNDIASGIIMKSPDGTRYRVTIANGGTLSVAAV